MTHSTATAPGKPTPRGQIRKTVAGWALPAPENWVWGVYDPHPFSRFIFDPTSTVLKKFGNPGSGRFSMGNNFRITEKALGHLSYPLLRHIVRNTFPKS